MGKKYGVRQSRFPSEFKALLDVVPSQNMVLEPVCFITTLNELCFS